MADTDFIFDNEYEQRRVLIEALVGRKHHRAYTMMPGFKARIDMLATMIPGMVDALFDEAFSEDEKMQAALRSMQAAPFLVRSGHEPGCVIDHGGPTFCRDASGHNITRSED